MPTIRVLLVDDHAILRQGLRALLSPEPDIEVVGEAGDGLEGLRLVRQTAADVAIVDCQLPKLSGLEVVRAIRQTCTRTEVIVLTMYDDAHSIFGMLKAGARSYLLKESAGIDLARAIRRAAVGQSVLDPAITATVVTMFKDGFRPHSNDELTAREHEVFRLMAVGQTSREIASGLGLSPKTIDNCRARILDKLHARNKAEAIVAGHRLGLIEFARA